MTETQIKDVDFVVVTTHPYGSSRDSQARWERHAATKTMNYKAAASYASKVIGDSANIRFSYEGRPAWSAPSLQCLEVYDVIGVKLGAPLVQFERYTGKVGYYPDFITDNFGQVMYVITAMQNAVKDIQTWANEWLTPAQIESELNLNRGVVRKYLHDHPELYEDELARRADGRTVQIKRGVAINRWAQK